MQTNSSCTHVSELSNGLTNIRGIVKVQSDGTANQA